MPYTQNGAFIPIHLCLEKVVEPPLPKKCRREENRLYRMRHPEKWKQIVAAYYRRLPIEKRNPAYQPIKLENQTFRQFRRLFC